MASRLVLVLGDLFIPDRAIDIPAKFKKLLTPGKIAQILCLGNLTSPSAYQFLKHLAPDLQLVKGDFDIPLTNPSQQTSQQQPQQNAATAEASFPIPTALSKVVTHGSLRIGFTHGDSILPPGDPDALLIAARQMDVDVLCWGGTCRFEAYEMEGKFFINPGSATGAVSWLDETLGSEGEGEGGYGGGEGSGDYGSVPSFVLMDVQGDVLVLYVYQLRVDGEGKETVGVEKVSFRKEASAVA
ncbi:Vacuolar protein sorting-associated protein 29 [Elasticomyces elasticus]|nr:Vacuolar protein sorting-associated protein 29 [Elasticomyces elasticus]